MQASNRIIFNTLITYLRSFITVFITLYSTKLIVKALGVEDFGLYSLVGGVVALLAFFKSALTASTQRFISVNIGKGLLNEVKKVVANSIVIHFLLGIIIVFIVEFLGLYFMEHKLVIPDNRYNAVVVVFHFVVASTFITIISVPAEAILNAHENMLFLAIIGVIEVLMKFCAAYFLTYVDDVDKLKLYALFLFCILFFMQIIKLVYCFFKYEETRISIKRDYSKSQIKEHIGFVGWNLVGAACSMGRGHGIAIVSNMFFGPIVNAAFGVANQVKSQSSFFSLTLLKVMNPQIMKSEGANDRKRMIMLSLMASKFGYFLLAIFAIPFIFEMPSIIKIWLDETPQYVVSFCQLILIGALVEQLTVGLISSVQAVGDIKKYQVLVGGSILFNLPITYFLLSSGAKAEVALIVFIMIEVFAGSLRVYLCSKIIGLPIIEYLNKVVLKVILPTLLVVFISFLLVNFFTFKFRFLLTIIVSIITFSIVFMVLSLEKNEKDLLKKLLNRIIAYTKN